MVLADETFPVGNCISRIIIEESQADTLTIVEPAHSGMEGISPPQCVKITGRNQIKFLFEKLVEIYGDTIA